MRYPDGMASPNEVLRLELKRCGQTRYVVSKATGIPQSVLSRFVYGQPLRGENFDLLCDYLGLELVKRNNAGGKARKGR